MEEIDFSFLLQSTLIIGVLIMLLVIIILIASKYLKVQEDKSIPHVEGLLPGSNCGACGTPGCHAFAEKLVLGETQPSACTQVNVDEMTKIAQYLGVNAGEQIKKVARIACAGGTNVAYTKAHYVGVKSCSAAEISGVGKDCAWGCLGLADCEAVCTYGAITMNEHGLPVVNEDLCTACGDCVDSCPKQLFSIVPVTNYLWVACKNLQKGQGVLQECEVACTACENCVLSSDCISMKKNLLTRNYMT